MFGSRHPRIASVLLLAFFTGGGYLVGTNAPKAEAPERGVATRPANGSAVESTLIDPKAETTPFPDSFVGVPTGYVLVHDDSADIDEQVGLLDPPSQHEASVHTTTRSNGPVLISSVPDLAASEPFIPSAVDWY